MSSSPSQPHPRSASPRSPRRQRGTRETLISLVGGGLVILILLAGILWARFTAGLVLGWVAQAVIMASGFIAGAMFVVGVVFTAIWVFALVQGTRIDRANNSHNEIHATGEDNAR